MTIRQFAEGFLAGEYYFERPENPGRNKRFMNFVNALGKYVDRKYYTWSSRVFLGYIINGSCCKFFNAVTNCCSGTSHENSSVLDGILFINFEDVDLSDGIDFEELL